MSTSANPPIFKLSSPLLCSILGTHLPVSDVATAFARTCKRFREIVGQDSQLWRLYVLTTFGAPQRAPSSWLEYATLLVRMGPNSFNDNVLGYSRVHLAASANDVDALSILLSTTDDAVNPRAKGASAERTPLMIAAAAHEASRAAKLLIERKASIDAVNDKGETALHFASRCGKLRVVKLLVEAKAKVDVENKSGHTPLMHACLDGDNDRSVRCLLEHKAHATLCSALNGDDALQIAQRRERLNCVALLAAHAAGRALPDVASEYDEDGFNNDGCALDGNPRLCTAAKSNDCAALRALLAEHDVDMRWLAGAYTALHSATKAGAFGATKLLIESRANVEAKESVGFRPLHFAAWASLDLVKLLVKARAFIDCETSAGRTPLMLAADSGHTDSVNFLLASRANPTLVSGLQKTAAEYALGKGYKELALLLDDADGAWRAAAALPSGELNSMLPGENTV